MRRRGDEAGDSRRLLAGAEAAARWPCGPGQHLPPWSGSRIHHPGRRLYSRKSERREASGSKGRRAHTAASLRPCLSLVACTTARDSVRVLGDHFATTAITAPWPLALRSRVQRWRVRGGVQACSGCWNPIQSSPPAPRLPPRHCGDRSSMEPRLPVLSRDEGAETFSGRSGDSGTAGRGVGCGLQPLSTGLCTRRPPRAGACNLQGRSSASPGLEGSAPDPGRPGKAARLRRQRRCAHRLVTQREQECGGPHPHGVQAARPLTLSLHSAD